MVFVITSKTLMVYDNRVHSDTVSDMSFGLIWDQTGSPSDYEVNALERLYDATHYRTRGWTFFIIFYINKNNVAQINLQ